MHTALVQPWESPRSAEADRWYVCLLPCLTDFAFLLPLFLLFGMLSGTTQLLSDGDTGWHIRTGDWIVQHGAVPKADFFSFTLPGSPWFAWEWGWDVLMATVHRLTGLAGVAFVNVFLLSLTAALLFRLIRRYSDNDILAFAFTIPAICGSIIHWLARPHLISWVFALLFAHLILAAEEGKRKMLLFAPALMLVWTNLHGGFFVGILLLLASAAGEAIDVALSDASRAIGSYRKAFDFLACALACSLITLANPYGWHLHEHVIAYLHDSTLLNNITEFQSISFHSAGSIFFECMLLIGAAAAFWCFSRRRVGLGLTGLLWAHAALFSGRNIPLFMLLSAAPAALMTEDFLNRTGRNPAFRRFATAAKETAAEFKLVERANRCYLLSGLAILVVAAGLAAGKGVFQSDFNPKNFPLPAITRVREAGFQHLFTSDQWADYLLYRYYPSQRVFMDGRSDFYGNSLVKKYQHIMSAQFDCEDLLRRFSIDGVMVKTDAPLATLLKHCPQWKLIFDDGSTIVFQLADRGRK
jgi:hypothetical protein